MNGRELKMHAINSNYNKYIKRPLSLKYFSRVINTRSLRQQTNSNCLSISFIVHLHGDKNDDNKDNNTEMANITASFQQPTV